MRRRRAAAIRSGSKSEEPGQFLQPASTHLREKAAEADRLRAERDTQVSFLKEIIDSLHNDIEFCLRYIMASTAGPFVDVDNKLRGIQRRSANYQLGKLVEKKTDDAEKPAG